MPIFDGNHIKHQDRFLTQYERGLSALAVSRRCAFLRDEDELPLLWMIQQRSWQPGGLRELALDLLFGKAACSGASFDRLYAVGSDPVVWLASHLERACLDPDYSLDLEDNRYWEGDFLAGLRAFRDYTVARAAGRLCSTTASKLVFETLENALESPGSMSVCFGPAGIGKTGPARQWCEMHPGVARYVETPAVENDRSFYSAIAEELGIPRGTSYNGQQTSLRIIDVLKESRLMLCLDEAHRIWPQKNRPTGSPMRVLWLTSLVNAGVPVGLVSMPEFFQRKQLFVKWTSWSDTQFNRRLSMVKELPVQLSEEELRAVTRHVMPAGSEACHEILVAYAQASKINLSAITETLATARLRAKKDGRTEATATDIQVVIREVRAPMDCTLAADPATLCASDDFPQVPAKRRRGRFAEVPRVARVLPAMDEGEEIEPVETGVVPRQVHRRAVAPSPAAR